MTGMKALNKAIIANGVLHDEGTPATEDLLEAIAAEHWDEVAESDGGPGDGDGDGDLDLTATEVGRGVKQFVELMVDVLLEDEDDDLTLVDVVQVAADAVGLPFARTDIDPTVSQDDAAHVGQPEESGSSDAGVVTAPAQAPPPVDYGDLGPAELRAEIDRRNGDLEPDAEGYITADRRSKDAMVAALQAADGADADDGGGDTGEQD